MEYTIQEIQKIVRDFAESRNWEDYPNIDKFDHVHEELIEVSQYLRYKTREEMVEFLANAENKKIIQEEMGDVLFGFTRLANQLGIDLSAAFDHTWKKIEKKYQVDNSGEYNQTWEKTTS